MRLRTLLLAAASLVGCASQLEAEADPSRAIALYDRGIAYAEMRDYPRAIADFDRAANLDPRSGLYERARCSTRAVANLELEVARVACDRAIAMADDPDDHVSALHSRGLVGLRQGRWQDAWNDFDAAMRTTPDMHAHYVYARGVAASRLGRPVEAQEDIARAIELDSRIAATFVGYGITP
jgi:tetratricopeptide (TPR) repeat protein